MANEGNIVEVSEKELHRVLDAAEATLDTLNTKIPELQRALNGDPEKKDEAGVLLEPGMRAELTAALEGLSDTRGVVEDVKKELRAIDDRLDRSDKVWRASEDIHNPRGFTSKTYRELADVYRASHEAYKSDGYTKKVEGYVRAADQSSTTDTLGGILVPTATWENVVYIMGEKSFLRAYASQIPLPTDDIKVPHLETIPQMKVQGTQGSEVTHGSLVFDDQQILQTKTYIGLNVIPNQLVQDAVKIWAIFWARVFTDAMALKENKGMFSEKPTDPNGAFSGIIQTVEAASVNKHEHTLASTHFSTLTYDDLVEIQNLPNENAHDGSKWFMNRAVAKYIFKMKTTDGLPLIGPLVQGMPGVQPFPNTGGPRGTPLLLDTMHTTSAMPGTNASDKAFIVYGNPAYTFWGERSPMAIEFSRDAKFEEYNTVMRVAERIAQKTISPDAWCIGRTA